MYGKLLAYMITLLYIHIFSLGVVRRRRHRHLVTGKIIGHGGTVAKQQQQHKNTKQLNWEVYVTVRREIVRESERAAWPTTTIRQAKHNPAVGKFNITFLCAEKLQHMCRMCRSIATNNKPSSLPPPPPHIHRHRRRRRRLLILV